MLLPYDLKHKSTNPTTPIILKHYVPEFVVGCMLEMYDKIVVVAGSYVILVEMPLKVF